MTLYNLNCKQVNLVNVAQLQCWSHSGCDVSGGFLVNIYDETSSEWPSLRFRLMGQKSGPKHIFPRMYEVFQVAGGFCVANMRDNNKALSKKLVVAIVTP